MKKHFDYYWEQIEEYFDFEKVYKAMKLLDWTWYMGNNTHGIPNIETIKSKAKEVCLEAYHNGYCYRLGFEAQNTGDLIELRFTLAAWETY